jgi:hypothetical protein
MSYVRTLVLSVRPKGARPSLAIARDIRKRHGGRDIRTRVDRAVRSMRFQGGLQHARAPLAPGRVVEKAH